MKYILAITFSLFSTVMLAQTYQLSGRVSDQNGQPVSFASIMQQNTSKGSSANSDGEYSIKLDRGSYDMIYRAIGYKTVVRKINVQADLRLDVKMEAESFQLNDVVISSSSEDPAYAIIRKAIKKRKEYLNEINGYTCHVYIKGLQKLLAAPKKFLGKDVGDITNRMGLDSTRTGIFYLSESESILSFERPDKYHEEMVASKFSGSNRAFSFNRASDMKINFYENLQTFGGGLSNRPFVSPIAENALFYYDYKYLGSTEENGYTVNKIQIIPKRASDPVFRGNIYIIDDSWRLSNADVFLTKETNINFVDTLKINQQYTPVSTKVWMPTLLKFQFTGGLFSFKFGGYFVAVFKDYEINPRLENTNFKEVVRITKGINKKDSIYWSAARPIPLTLEEKIDYDKKDSLAIKRESKPYLDSLDKAQNKLKIVPFLIGDGYRPRNRYNKTSYHFSSLKDAVFYNTVEGFGVNYFASYNRQIDSINNKFLQLTGKLRYGFTSEKFYASIAGTIPLKSVTARFNIGSDVTDLNNMGTLSQFGNSVNSLLYERNFVKLYQRRFLGGSLTRRFGALIASASSVWSDRKWLPNASDFSWRDIEDVEFTSNNPFLPGLDAPLFEHHQGFELAGRITYDFSGRYVTYPTGRYYLPSKFPTLGLNYRKGVSNFFGSDTDYDLISADLTKSDIPFGFYGKFSFFAGAGKFLNNRRIYYPDFKHFIGTQSLSYEAKANTFILMDYYPNSTSESYFEAHAEHNFSGFITNKIPLVRKLKLQELVGFNYLTTPKVGHYKELYAGVQYLNFRVVYGWSFQNSTNVKNDFRISYKL